MTKESGKLVKHHRIISKLCTICNACFILLADFRSASMQFGLVANEILKKQRVKSSP